MSYERLELIDGVTKWNTEKVQHLEDAIIKNENDIQKYHNDTVVEMQADWDQGDETAKDYVKNRTHYKSSKTVTIIENFETETYETMRGDEGYEVMMVTLTNSFIPSDFTISTEDQVNNLCVTINNELIALTVGQHYGLSNLQWNLSNGLRLTYWAGKGKGPEWNIYLQDYSQFPVGEHLTINIYTKAITYIALDEKYLPPSVFTQSDWNCNNKNDVAYVKNRTHYSYYQGNHDMEAYGEFPRYYTIPADDNVVGPGYWMGTEAFVLEGQYILTAQSDWQFINVNDNGFEVYAWEFFNETNNELVRLEVQVMRDGNNYNTIWDYNFGYGHFEKAYEVVKTLDDKYIPNSVAKNLDWNEDRENSPSYIQNRTHYPYKGPGTLIYGEHYEFNGEHNEFITQGSLPYEQIIESDLSENEAPGYWLGSMGGYYLSGYGSLIADAYSDWRRVNTIDNITSYRCGIDGNLSVQVDVQPIGSNSYRVILTHAWTDFSDYGYEVYTLGLKYKQLDEVYLPDTIAREPNWEENNPYSPSYIKNRPFYVEYSRVEPYEPIYHPMNEKFIPDTIARVTDIPVMDTALTSEGAAADAKAVGEAISNLTGDLESLTWSDLGENVIAEDQLVFRDDDFVGVSTYDGIEGTSLSIGDTCKVILSGDILLPGLKSECIVTIDENYSFTIMGYSDGFKMTYNNKTNQYKFERIGEQPLPVGTISIIKLGQVEVTEIDEKYIPNTIARAPKATLDYVTETPTAEQYNALLDILKQAGILI